jgi:exosortase/archaeosortase family protein
MSTRTMILALVALLLIPPISATALEDTGQFTESLGVAVLAPSPPGTTYALTYYLRSAGTDAAYGPGSYQFYPAADHVSVYILNSHWVFLGYLDNLGAVVPSSMPALSFPAGSDAALATPIVMTGFGGGGGAPISNPEFKSLRRLAAHIPFYTGRFMAAKHAIRGVMQRSTAIGAHALLNAVRVPTMREGTLLHLPSVTTEVIPSCSGTDLAKILVLLGAGLALAIRRIRVPWKIALVVLAAATALEMNAVRVAATSVGFEVMGRSFWAWKETVAGVATGLGVVQVIGLAWMSRSPAAR